MFCMLGCLRIVQFAPRAHSTADLSSPNSPGTRTDMKYDRYSSRDTQSGPQTLSRPRYSRSIWAIVRARSVETNAPFAVARINAQLSATAASRCSATPTDQPNRKNIPDSSGRWARILASCGRRGRIRTVPAVRAGIWRGGGKRCTNIRTACLALPSWSFYEARASRAPPGRARPAVHCAQGWGVFGWYFLVWLQPCGTAIGSG